MKTPKYGRGDTIKLLPDTPFPRVPGSLFVVRNVFEYSQLNATVKSNLADYIEVSEDTPVYYCSDEINYNCFVPESYLKSRLFFFKKDMPLVEAATPQDKLYLRVAMLAEASRSKNYRFHVRNRDDDEGVE